VANFSFRQVDNNALLSSIMDELQQIIDLFTEHIFPRISNVIVEKTINYAIGQNPEIKNDLVSIKNSQDVENVIEKIKVVLEARAGDGGIDIDKTIIQALGGATFDHERGIITIGDSKVTAKVLVIGGSVGSSGETTIGGNTEVGSEKARMKTKGNAQVKIRGNASIRFS